VDIVLNIGVGLAGILDECQRWVGAEYRVGYTEGCPLPSPGDYGVWGFLIFNT